MSDDLTQYAHAKGYRQPSIAADRCRDCGGGADRRARRAIFGTDRVDAICDPCLTERMVHA